jgi:EAL domain-containing protein (putative c-di-GMP-specific phosphodiesterase class I)/AmiR/NasT family two-component response regulator
MSALPSSPRIRVLVADDDPHVRLVLADVIRSDASLELVGIAASGTEAVALSLERFPDVVLMDVRMPNGGGVEATSELTRGAQPPFVLALSVYTDSGSVAAMLRAGAAGYVTKTADADEISRAIHSVVRGESVLSGEVASEVVTQLRAGLRERHEESMGRATRVERLQSVLAGGGLRMVYQPIVDITDPRRAVGFEALARFSLEPAMAPDAWFEEAHKLGLGERLELHAIAVALGALNDAPPHCYVAVNAGPTLLTSSRLATMFEGRDIERIVLEVTEHAAIDDYKPVLNVLDSWRERGLRLAVDDAGAGYASLRHILKLKPDIIKLDISLVRNVCTDRPTLAMAKSLAAFGTEIGATILAEGVESVAELELLATIGVSRAQGYLIGRPMPPERAFGLPTQWDHLDPA